MTTNLFPSTPPRLSCCHPHAKPLFCLAYLQASHALLLRQQANSTSNSSAIRPRITHGCVRSHDHLSCSNHTACYTIANTLYQHHFAVAQTLDISLGHRIESHYIARDLSRSITTNNVQNHRLPIHLQASHPACLEHLPRAD